jgi:hypothetical protein
MEPNGSSPYSQDSASGPQMNSAPHFTVFFKIRFNISLPIEA